jgi:branched-chain amino acid transport system substrate-binding protein
VGGDMSKMDELREALKSANYNSVRGKYTYGNNGMPIQNFYLREVVTDADGNWTTKMVKTVFENHQDPYAAECKLK